MLYNDGKTGSSRKSKPAGKKNILTDTPVNLGTEKAPETLFQLVLHFLGKINGRLSKILIAGLIFLGGLVFIWSQIPEQGKLNIINRVLSDSPSSAGIYPSVEIEEGKLTYNFSEWTPVPPSGDTSQFCKVTTDEEMIVRRVRNEASYLVRRAGTSGTLPTFTSKTHQFSYKESSYERRGGIHMSHYEILLDISKEPVNIPFNAHLRSVRYGAFKDNNHEWASVNVFQPTRVVTIELQFRDNKPGRNFQFSSSAEFDGNNNVPLSPTQGNSLKPIPGEYEVKDNVIRWTIQSPKIGYCYRIDWDW